MPIMPRENANGEGSVWDRPDGRAGAALYVPTPDGGQKRLTTTKKNKREARKWLRQMLAERDGGLVVASENPTLREWLGEWLREVVEPSVAPKTLEKRTYHVNAHILPALGNVRLADLRPRQIHAFYVRMSRREPPLAASTRRAIHQTLRMALAQGVRWGVLPSNPVDLVEPPRPTLEEEAHEEEKVRALTDAQAEELFAVESRWRNYYVVAIRAGARPGEMLGLKWGDLIPGEDLDSIKIRRSLAVAEDGSLYLKGPKNRWSRRTIPLHWQASEALTNQREMLVREGLSVGPDDWIFPSTTGTPMNRHNLLYRHLKPDLRALGLPALSLHELRHTFASIMLYEWRVPADVVAGLLGHKNIRMTQELYGHFIKSAPADAMRSLRRSQKPPEEATG